MVRKEAASYRIPMCRSYDYLLCLVNRNNKLTQLLLKRERLFNAVTVALAGEQTVKVCSRARRLCPLLRG